MVDDQLVEKARERRAKLMEMTQAKVGKRRVGYGDDPKLVKDVVKLNVLDIDDILGGGFRLGRAAMVIGPAAVGKTLFTQWVMKAFQDLGHQCAFMDPEKTYEPDWFERTGVNVDELIVFQPESIEQAADVACMWIENDVKLVVIDSLAWMSAKAQVDAEMVTQDFMGLNARKLTEALKKMTNSNTDSLILCTNQLRSKIGVVYGSPDSIPGGRALEYAMSYIIKVRRKGWIKEGDERVGYHLGVSIEKNKLAQPFMETTIPFMFSGQIDTVAGALDIALELNLIEKKGAFYTWNEERIHGRPKLLQYFRDNLDQLQLLQELIKLGGD